MLLYVQLKIPHPKVTGCVTLSESSRCQNRETRATHVPTVILSAGLRRGDFVVEGAAEVAATVRLKPNELVVETGVRV